MSDDVSKKLNFKRMAQSRNRVYKSAKTVLLKLAGHKLGSCDKHPDLDHFECKYCESWRQLKKGFARKLSEKADVKILSFSPPFTRKIEIHDPGLISSLYDFESDQAFTIDEKTQMMIYELELWLSIQRMVLLIEFYLESTPNPDQHFETMSSPNSEFLSHARNHFNCFYFVRDGLDCKLYFPKVFLDRDIKAQKTLLSLFQDEA